MADGRSDVIVTGFEPFEQRPINRSWEVVAALPEAPGLEKVQLPVDFAALARLVPELVARAGRALVMVGESSLAEGVEVERIALNVAHARIADNRGAQPSLAELVPEAPLARYARWDAGAIVDVLSAAGVPARVSHHAGTYACNAALYLALEAAAERPAPAIIGFLHVPVSEVVTSATVAAGVARLLLTFR